jgi:hypothetical protein
MSTTLATSTDPANEWIKVTSATTGEVVMIKRPTPPPMRVGTKGWLRTTVERVPLEELKRRNATA